MRAFLVSALLCVVACTEESGGDDVELPPPPPEHGDALDPSAAPRVVVDRFSRQREALGLGQVPAANEAVDFDERFTTQGLGPGGEPVTYYDFGPSSGFTMPAFVLVDLDGAPVEGQLPILSASPGDLAYSDFWQITDVEVPEGYEANTITSAAEVDASGYPQDLTFTVWNRPLVPQGSTAGFGLEDGRLFEAWLDDEVAYAFGFEEAEPNVRGALVDYAPIYVCMTEAGAFCVDADGETHNVVGAVPGEPGYSPLWRVSIYPEAAFDAVGDLESALETERRPAQPALVNCPLIEW